MPDGRLIYKIMVKIGLALGMIPTNDEEHMKLIGKAMFIAANVQIIGSFIVFFWLSSFSF